MATIRFLSAGDTDGCSFYRCQEPARVLRDLGHDATSSRVLGLGEAITADVLVFQRSSELPALELMNTLLNRTERPKIVYEIDDDLLNLPEHFGSIHASYADEARRDRILMMLSKADLITTTNEHLASRMRGGDMPETVVIPNFVPARFVLDVVPEQTGPPVIGWGGSGSHRKDFEQVIIPLRGLLRDTDVTVHTIGADYTPRLRAAARVDVPYGMTAWETAVAKAMARVRHTPWVDGVDGYMAELDFTIGLAPLEDNLFNRSKSDIKIKEYAARGIVSVVSAVGPYLAEFGEPGAFIPRWFTDQSGGWRPTITYLLEDPAFLLKMRTEALEWAQRNTLEAHAGRWETALLG